MQTFLQRSTDNVEFPLHRPQINGIRGKINLLPDTLPKRLHVRGHLRGNFGKLHTRVMNLQASGYSGRYAWSRSGSMKHDDLDATAHHHHLRDTRQITL